jgi:hypothetical protein
LRCQQQRRGTLTALMTAAGRGPHAPVLRNVPPLWSANRGAAMGKPTPSSDATTPGRSSL